MESNVDATLTWLESSIDAKERSLPDFFERSLRPSILLAPKPIERTNKEFEILRSIGEGGMGQVFLAKQNSLERQVAIKTLRGEQNSDQAQLAMLHEARITGAIEHPNIVPIHTLSHDPNGVPLLVMKRIEGTSWKELLLNKEHQYWSKEPAERLQQNIEILMQVCNAIHYAHKQGIIHRDIKPANVMLGNFGEVYVLDWGIALRLEDHFALNQEISGTLAYIAPEMLVKGAKLSIKTDIYLLGATLYEVLAGQTLHKTESLLGVLTSTMRRTKRDYPDGTPELLISLCEDSIANDPAARVESALSFRQRLASFLQRRSSIDLASVANQKLTQLRERPVEEAAPLEVYRLSGEIQFGLEQARRGWPENEISQRGLMELSAYMAEFELHQRNAIAARAHIALLLEPPERLTKRLAELEKELLTERGAVEKLRSLEYQNDTEVTARQRLFVMVVGNLQFVGGLLALSYLSPVEIWRASPLSLLILQGVFGVGVVIIASVARSYFFRNNAGKQLYLAALFLSTMLILAHIVGFLMNTSAAQIFLWDIFLWTLSAGLLGVFYAPIFFWNVPANVALLLIGVLAPSLSPWLLWLSFLFMTFSIGRQWRRGPRAGQA